MRVDIAQQVRFLADLEIAVVELGVASNGTDVKLPRGAEGIRLCKDIADIVIGKCPCDLMRVVKGIDIPRHERMSKAIRLTHIEHGIHYRKHEFGIGSRGLDLGFQ